MRLQELLGIGEKYIYENCILYFIAFLDMSNLCLKRGDQSEIAIVSSIYISLNIKIDQYDILFSS
jgi:hypothetical protein